MACARRSGLTDRQGRSHSRRLRARRVTRWSTGRIRRPCIVTTVAEGSAARNGGAASSATFADRPCPPRHLRAPKRRPEGARRASESRPGWPRRWPRHAALTRSPRTGVAGPAAGIDERRLPGCTSRRPGSESRGRRWRQQPLWPPIGAQGIPHIFAAPGHPAIVSYAACTGKVPGGAPVLARRFQIGFQAGPALRGNGEQACAGASTAPTGACLSWCPVSLRRRPGPLDRGRYGPP